MEDFHIREYPSSSAMPPAPGAPPHPPTAYKVGAPLRDCGPVVL